MNDRTVTDMNSGIMPPVRDNNDQTFRDTESAAARPLLAIAATFTADPLVQPLQFWIETIELPVQLAVAPYGQLLRELLDPQSLLSQNRLGSNILLLRPEDWIHDRQDEPQGDNIEHIRHVADELANGVERLLERSRAALLVFFCPPSARLAQSYADVLTDVERDLLERFARLPRTRCWSHADISRLYPGIAHEDERTDRIAHIPFANEYFVALATLVARASVALLKPQPKVIAIDCDNTLWQGICGEDGAAGVQLTPAHLELQRALVRQFDAGVLLCLCSKNNPDDVAAVFRSRPQMLLREEHLICSRVNWQSKSANLSTLAQELGLALDSFVLLDDSPLECAEVQTHCPAVLTLQVPDTQDGIEHFVRHCWAFDRLVVTDEARRRTAQYRQNQARREAQRAATDLASFLASLKLEVRIEPMGAAHLERVAELVQRTNQFNLTTVRRRASEIEALAQSGTLRILVVHARDRFGDYGLVGAVFYRHAADALDIDTWVLSCRALGRGVEHRIVNELGRIAADTGLAHVWLRFRRSPRNAPAAQFLQASFRDFRVDSIQREEEIYAVPTAFAATLGGALAVAEPAAGEDTQRAQTSPPTVRTSARWHETVLRLGNLTELVRAVEQHAARNRRREGQYVGPRTRTEEALATIWRELLGLPEVGIEDDFFALGGDSLLAVRVVARIESTLGLELPLHGFFEGPTVAQLAQRLGNAAAASAAIEAVSRDRQLPLSWSQQRLWFIDELEGGSAAYHIPIALRLQGRLNRAALDWSLQAIAQRHEILRTIFVKDDSGEPVQRLLAHGRFPVRAVDLSGSCDAQDLLKESRAEALEPFDLAVGPLVRGRLLQLSCDEHVLLITLHHIVGDGWSLGILTRELAALYAGYSAGTPDGLQPLPIQYADYAHWQRAHPANQLLQEQVEYWHEHLQGAPGLLELPTDRPRPPMQSYRGANLPVALSAELVAQLKQLCQQLNITLAMSLYAAWSVVLSRLSGQTDIVIGMPIANRRRAQLEGLIGLFVNTLAVRFQLDDDPPVLDLLQRVKHVMLGAYANQDAPFEQVVDKLRPARSLSHSPIFQAMLALQNPADGPLQLPGLRMTQEDVPLHTAQFDLLLSLQESSQGLTGFLNYATDLFDPQTIERWLGYFATVLRALVSSPQWHVSRLPLLSAGERRLIVDELNATRAPYAQSETIHGLFEEQVRRTPQAPAVWFDGQSLTYEKLNARANQLGWHLRGHGVGPDRLVGICAERSIELVIGVLGILKAGGAYVPIDPDYPPERVAYILEDAAPAVLLTQAHLLAKLPATRARVIALDADWEQVACQPDEDLDRATLGLHSRHLVYVIYTSGSTGRPKGAMNEHRALVNRLQWMQHEYGLAQDDRVLQKTPFSFDVSVWEFFWTLMTGACLIVARPRGHQDPGHLRQLIEQAGVTTLHFVPSMLQVFLDEHRPGQCSTVRRVICSGEELPASLQRKFHESLPQAGLANLYGPTEAAIDVTYWKCRVDAIGTRVPIGRPIWNVQMYVLDAHREPAPFGVVGEIYIGGVGVGRGYLNRPELTAERFVADPFTTDPAARLYKTGDLGRWRGDGALEYLGRNDHQVKIRGLRIELGEIEAQLLRDPRVKETVVIAREDVAGDKRLVAYLVPAREQERESACSAEELRAHLKAALPDYMVPSAFVMLERMPLSPNGKLERRALPPPDSDALARRPYAPPTGEVEEILAGIWQVLLGVERVGRHDNFFELGGHSLLIVQMMERLRAFGLSADLRQVFASSTLAELAIALRREALEAIQAPPNLIPNGCSLITPQMLPLVQLEPEHIERIVAAVPAGAGNVQDIYPLAPLQEGILFHHLLSEHAGDTYVVPTVLAVSSRRRLDELIAALQAVIDRHDVLRTAVVWETLPQPVQVVYRRATLPVEEVRLDPTREALEQVRTWLEPEHQVMDLRLPPLLHLRIAEDPRGNDRWYVLMRLHHIIGDNTSQEAVVAEVIAHLHARADSLPPSVPYREHVAQALAQRRAGQSEAFFQSKLGDVEEPTAPFGLLDVHGDGTCTREASAQLDSDVAHRARRQARQLGVSTATFFHAAWSLVVAHTSGREDVVFGTVLLGRMRGRAGAQRTLGMFINTLPLRLQLTELNARQLVEQTQRELIELVSQEQASLAAAQKCSGVSANAPLFTALLNFRHSVGGAQQRWADAEGLEVVAVHERTNYPITLSVDDAEPGMLLTAQTDMRIDPQRLIGYMQEAVRSLARALESAPQTAALLLPILPERERELIVREFNATHAPYPDRASHVLFEEQVRRTPDALAAVYEQERLTYVQLNSRANRLARYLCAQGVEAGQYVPIMMTRSLQMLIAHLAVLKCGAVYVPLDPELPIERRTFIVRDCGATRLVTDGGTPPELGEIAVTCIDCGAAYREIEQQGDTNVDVPSSAAAPSYVMYTSGSTGIPKGVVVPHRAVNRLAINNGYAEIRADDCLAHYSNPAFDASTFEIWGALLSGARVLIVPQPIVLEGERFAQLLEREGATMLYMSVGLFNQYTQVMANVFRRLRCLMVGGDSLEPTAIRRVLSESPPRRLLNAYGPTECTTFATTHHIESVAEGTRSIPIGRPMSNAQIYVLDRRGAVAPLGVAGELYIGGAGVACGYLKRPELTAERFIPDPFSAVPGERLYKTGDLARWHHDGVIDFLGRNDQQVKVRGFRVELGEVEARLVEHEQVKEACVVARQDGRAERRLVAYVVPRTLASAPRVDELRNYLKARLPEYMVPSAFVLLERMPLSSTGKVDRRALPAPDMDSYTQREYEPPQGPVEEILAGVWQNILQVAQVGRCDNFFELGGHSLLMVQMMERLRRVGLSTEVRRVFQSPTLAELASVLTSHAVEQYEVPPNLIPPGSAVIEPQMLPLVELAPVHIERIVQTVPGGASNVEDIYPLAPLQEGILFHHLLDEGNGDTYVLPTVLTVESRERLVELIAALQTVIDRHPVLRTAVLWEQLPRALQVVYRQATLPVDEVAFDLERSVPEQIAEWIGPQRQRLDIRHAPLMRLQVAPDPQSARWYVMLQLHHMTIDHVALEIVTSEVVAHMEGRAQRLVESAPYRNHVAQSLAYARKHDAEAFFRGKLADIDEPTAPFGLLDVHGDGTEIEDAYEAVEPALAARIRSQARRLGVSAATLFHAGWALVVAHTSGRDDVVFGSVLLGRLQVSAGAQRTLGMFINTLPLRLRLHGMMAKGLVEQTQRELVELLGHEQASLAIAQRCSGIAATTPLFSALLNYRHSVPNSGAEWASASGVGVVASQERTNYPVTLSVDDLGHGFTLKAQVDRRVPAQRMTACLHTAMRSLIDALDQSPQTAVLELSIVPQAELLERARLNATAVEYPRHALVHQLFEDQVWRTPAALAVVHGKRTFTYQQLNGRANQFARRLRELGVGADDIVGICVERRPEMVVGLLGTLKAGAGYLPLDPSYPPERLAYMLQDAAPRVVLTQRSLQGSISETASTHVVLLDDDAPGEIADMEAADLPVGERGQSSDNLLYVIYTSGSTGRPKGTAMPHRAMVNLIEWHRRSFGASESCRVLQFAALSFDVAFQETFSTLCTGGTLVLLDEWIRRDTPALLELLRRERVERLFVPPLMLQSLAECLSDGVEPGALRDIITAGEQLRISPEIVGFFERLPRCRLHNHYGPTETHVVTAVTLQGPARTWPVLPSIGGPIANTQIHILDERRRPVLLGVAGEIYIAGANVAREYLHRPELTQERFVRDPFSEDPAARMYKTGDLAKWRADGTIEYLGRNDYQVKIRGYRIELGEIEARLMQHDAVKEAAVVAREDTPGQKCLVAYVTARGGAHASADELCAYAKSVLPEYMVPSAFVPLDELPLTPSGKLNRRALPAPELQAYAVREYVPPQGGVEGALAEIWRAVLGLERVGRDDDFFELGGHSLLALKALFKTNQALSAALRVADIYRNPTIRSLAQRIGTGVAEDEHVDLSREAVLDANILPQPGSLRLPARVILLTGATGFVGRFLLSELLAQTSATVYCLVRARSAQQAQARLRSTLLKWDLWREEFASRIVAIAGDLRRPRLGLDDETFERLGRDVDSIYHCATSMNHLETYAMAKPANVDAARDLLRLAVLGRPKLVNYVSTLGVFNASASEAKRVVYENTPIDHELHRRSQGYTASKWVGEKLFLTAAQRGIPCNVFRLGLVWADSEKGRFDESQNVYQVLKSSLLSGYGIKDYRYPMPPTPVDYVARAIVFLASRYGGDGRIFHISSAQQAIDDLFERVGDVTSTLLQLLPYYDWILAMKRLHEAGTSLPAVPLIEYAFTMSEEAFREYQGRVRSAANIRFDFSRTHADLQHAGIIAPELTDELLRVCLEGMVASDPDLQQLPAMHPAVLATTAELRQARGLN